MQPFIPQLKRTDRGDRTAASIPAAIRVLGLVALLGVLAAPAAPAGPYILPGDTALRHDLQRLADAGIITGPMSSWPLAWGPVLDDLRQARNLQALPRDVRDAYARVRDKGAWETRVKELRLRARAAAALEPARIRSFRDTPREEGEAALGLDWTGERFSVSLTATGALDPDDDEELRPDGSHLAIALGNFTLAASTLDRWWGPGWDGSLVLSNNARPMPALVIDRNYTGPFETKWLRWLGPWDLSLLWGLLDDPRAVEDAQFLGARFAFRPLTSLEIGISRTAQWCGEGRPCDLDTFADLLVGKDNRSDDLDPADEPGNQTAALDFRWSLAPLRLPAALYGQFLAEDEAGGFPSRYIGQLGAELHGRLGEGRSWRAYLEAVDTACEFYDTPARFNCAYNHAIYRTGYRYYGRAVGHGADNDARVATLGLVLIDAAGNAWQGHVRAGELNRGGAVDAAHSLTPLPQNVLNVELVHHRPFRYGRLEFGVGYDRFDGNAQLPSSNEARGFIQWRSDY